MSDVSGINNVVDAVVAKTGVTKAEAKRVILGFVDVINESDKVQIAGFGSFKWTDVAARQGTNPFNGQPLNIPAKRVLKFKTSKK